MVFLPLRRRALKSHPSAGLQNDIVRKYSKDIRIAPAACDIAFDQKIISIQDFLPETTFHLLREAVDRQDQSERVHIPVHKRGATISYHDLHYCAPELIAFYLSPQLHEWCSAVIGEQVQPTPLNDLSSCSLLIYDQPNDHIGWHYDHDFYRGRHFTALLSLVNTGRSGAGLSSAHLMVREGHTEKVIPTPPNTMVLFEGAYICHSVSSLRESERRIILSMTFCTDPTAGTVQTWERRIKDVAYFGWRALWG